MKKHYLQQSFIFFLLIIVQSNLLSQPLAFENDLDNKPSAIVRKYLSPVKIVWASGNELVENSHLLLVKGNRQAELTTGTCLKLKSGEADLGGIILDFGTEIQGGIQIITTRRNPNPVGRVRIRFGESVSETMSEVGKQGATNDHAMRDQIVVLPWLGSIEVGNSGFRFVRIDMVDPNATIEIEEINAIMNYRNIPYLGSFNSNDDRLNKIWKTGAYTVHLNMQEYLWDGIKRDRLVWVGDLHPEVMTVSTVFGYNEVVNKSLDLIRDITPLPSWMNGISSYSMWWVLIHRDWYYYQGDLAYLKQQKDYLSGLIRLLASKIDESGKENLDGWRFLDWPSTPNQKAIHAGLQSLMVMTFKAGVDLSKVLNDKETTDICLSALAKLKKHTPEITESKQAAALLALSNIVSPEMINEKVLSQNGVHNMSTFFGYYMLNARAEAGDVAGAMDNIREYWGAMLDIGATTFWEGFNIEWMENAARIDEIVPEGKIDIHSARGEYCYEGFRHSFCHGWASGPTAWLSRYVLGVEPLKPGCREVGIKPNLGNLEWVEGTFPTPLGVIKIKHTKQANGTIKSEIDAPRGVKIIRR
ncbi:MAG: alpha-L-rhamnosidase [Mediterranea sp.]|nr:alpha-L-rhamnosidase [Mediterranea sp.]